MSYITILSASKIIGVSKKTLFRWDNENRFKPSKRESILKIRLYDDKEVKIMAVVWAHEKKFREINKKWKIIRGKLEKYRTEVLMSKEEIRLQEEEDKIIEERQKLREEFDKFPQEIRSVYKKFLKI